MSGNLSSVISDHLIQFLDEPSKFTKKSPQMVCRQRCYKNSDKFQFRADFIKVNWASLCHNPDPNSALEYFLKIVEKLLDNHAPYENIKFSKPWIIPGLAYSIIKSKIQKFLEGKRSTQKRKL